LIFVVTGLSYYFITYQKRDPSEKSESFFTELMIWLHSESFRKLVRKTLIYSLGVILAVVILSVGISLLGSSVFAEKETEKKCINTVEYLNKYKSHSNSFPADLEKMTGNSPVRREWIKDGWGNPLIYSVTENGNNFLLISKGKDSKENTEDDLKFNKGGKID
ncbi:MAG TPA: type II secretion system protein GspG, partial [Cytophagaceae bacterium]|nr:type II secretion system protein GspG [Cytophagaceae bacterium]